MQGIVTKITSEKDLVQFVDLDFPRATPPVSLHIQTHERIGQGSFGTVYRATTDHPKYSVIALKVATGKSPRLLQEMQVMRKVCTKGRLHIARMEFVAINEAETMIVAGLELCLPLTLHDFLVSYRLTSELDMMYLAHQVLLAVAGVHDEECVHRDIKLQNFVFDLDCNVKLIDFGLAYNSLAPPAGDVVAGTVSFMAPEMANNALTKSNRASVGAPADVWSVGIVLFSIVTQRSPYPNPGEDDSSSQPTGNSKVDANQTLVRRVARGQWVWPATVSSVSSELRQLIESMLVTTPADRPTIRHLLSHPIWIRGQSPPKALVTFLGLERFDTLLASTPEHEHHLLRNVERKSQIVNLSRAASVASNAHDDDEKAPAATSSTTGADGETSELNASAADRIEANASRRGLEKEFEVVLDDAMRKKPTRSRSKSLVSGNGPVANVPTSDSRPSGTSLQRPEGRRSRSKSVGGGRSAPDALKGDDELDLALPTTLSLGSRQVARDRSASVGRLGPMPIPTVTTTPPPASAPRSPSLVPALPPRASSSSQPRPPTGAITTSSISQRRERSRSRSLAREEASLQAPTLHSSGAVTNEENGGARPAARGARRVPVVQIHTPSTFKLLEAQQDAEVTLSAPVKFLADDEDVEQQPLVVATSRGTPSPAPSRSHDVPAPRLTEERLLGTRSSALAAEERKQRTAVARLLQSQMDHFIGYLWLLIEEDQTRYNITWLCETQAMHIDHPHVFQSKKDDKGVGYDEGFVCDVCLKVHAPKKRGATMWDYFHCSCGMDMCPSCHKGFLAQCVCPDCKKAHRNIGELRAHVCAKSARTSGAASPPTKRPREAPVASPPAASRTKVTTPQRPFTKKPQVASSSSDDDDDDDAPPLKSKRRVEPTTAPAKKGTQPKAPPPATKKSVKSPPVPKVAHVSSPSKAASAAATKLNLPTRQASTTVAPQPVVPPVQGKWKPELASRVASKPPALPPPTPEERAMLVSGDGWVRYFHYASTLGPQAAAQHKTSSSKRARSSEAKPEDDAFVYQIQPGRTGVIFLGMDAPAHSVVYSLSQGCMLVVGNIDPSSTGSDSVMVMPCTTTLHQFSELASIADGLQREDERLLKQRRAPGTMSVYQPPMSGTRAKDAVFQYVRWFRYDEPTGIAVFLLNTGGVQVFVGTDVELRWKDPSRRFLVRCNGVCETVDHSTFPLMQMVDNVISSTIDLA